MQGIRHGGEGIDAPAMVGAVAPGQSVARPVALRDLAPEAPRYPSSLCCWFLRAGVRLLIIDRKSFYKTRTSTLCGVQAAYDTNVVLKHRLRGC